MGKKERENKESGLQEAYIIFVHILLTHQKRFFFNGAFLWACGGGDGLMNTEPCFPHWIYWLYWPSLRARKCFDWDQECLGTGCSRHKVGGWQIKSLINLLQHERYTWLKMAFLYEKRDKCPWLAEVSLKSWRIGINYPQTMDSRDTGLQSLVSEVLRMKFPSLT